VPALALLGGHFALHDVELERQPQWESDLCANPQTDPGACDRGAVIASWAGVLIAFALSIRSVPIARADGDAELRRLFLVRASSEARSDRRPRSGGCS
jgi:hypothetical protein